ncbi:MAG TPA: hypothetical protein VLV83_04375 [Acidobacteriota bacterium]|nr:hypothetical protein [Acidobacteriota bacterium]
MGLLFGWMPRALNSTWGGSALLLLLMALAGHRLRRYLEGRQAQTQEGEGAPEVEILSPGEEEASLPQPDKPRED